MNLTQRAKKAILEDDDREPSANTALIDGVRKFVNVRDLDIDLIDSINPFGEAYNILSKSMNEGSLRQVASVISAKRSPITPNDAIIWARRASKFKKENGRSPALDSPNPYEKLMAEGATAFMRFRKEGRYE